MKMKIVKPEPIEGYPAKMRATKTDIYKGRLVELWGKILNGLGVAGFVQEVNFYDEIKGEEVTIRKGSLFTVISIGNRDYYFRRPTGRFDGTGFQVRRRLTWQARMTNTTGVSAATRALPRSP